MNKEQYEKVIISVPNFPKEGVVFKDMNPLLQNHLDECISDMGKEVNWNDIDFIVGVESRGFILGSAMAIKFNKGFIPVRKKGKLPPPIIAESYDLEYGSDTLEMKVNETKARVLIVDDVLATGGTLRASIKLCESNNFDVKAVSVLMDLRFLNSLHSERENIYSVLKYE